MAIEQSNSNVIVNASIKFPTFYFINLDRAEVRRRKISDSFSSRAMPYRRVPAIDAKDTKFAAMGAPDLDSSGHSSKCNAACYVSHLKAIYTFYQTRETVGVICEDDLTFEYERFWPASFIDIVSNAPQGWGILLLSMICNRSQTITTYAQASERYFRLTNNPEIFSAMCYVIKRPVAGEILKLHCIDPEAEAFNFFGPFPAALFAENIFRNRLDSWLHFPPLFTFSDNEVSQIHQSHEIAHQYSKQLIDSALIEMKYGPANRSVIRGNVALRISWTTIATYSSFIFAIGNQLKSQNYSVVIVMPSKASCPRTSCTQKFVSFVREHVNLPFATVVPPRCEFVFSDMELEPINITEIGIIRMYNIKTMFKPGRQRLIAPFPEGVYEHILKSVPSLSLSTTEIFHILSPLHLGLLMEPLGEMGHLRLRDSPLFKVYRAYASGSCNTFLIDPLLSVNLVKKIINSVPTEIHGKPVMFSSCVPGHLNTEDDEQDATQSQRGKQQPLTCVIRPRDIFPLLTQGVSAVILTARNDQLITLASVTQTLVFIIEDGSDEWATAGSQLAAQFDGLVYIGQLESVAIRQKFTEFLGTSTSNNHHNRLFHLGAKKQLIDVLNPLTPSNSIPESF